MDGSFGIVSSFVPSSHINIIDSARVSNELIVDHCSRVPCINLSNVVLAIHYTHVFIVSKSALILIPGIDFEQKSLYVIIIIIFSKDSKLMK